MKIKRLILLSKPLDDWLRKEANANGVSVSEIIRRVLDLARAIKNANK